MRSSSTTFLTKVQSWGRFVYHIMSAGLFRSQFLFRGWLSRNTPKEKETRYVLAWIAIQDLWPWPKKSQLCARKWTRIPMYCDVLFHLAGNSQRFFHSKRKRSRSTSKVFFFPKKFQGERTIRFVVPPKRPVFPVWSKALIEGDFVWILGTRPSSSEKTRLLKWKWRKIGKDWIKKKLSSNENFLAFSLRVMNVKSPAFILAGSTYRNFVFRRQCVNFTRGRHRRVVVTGLGTFIGHEISSRFLMFFVPTGLVEWWEHSPSFNASSVGFIVSKWFLVVFNLLALLPVVLDSHSTQRFFWGTLVFNSQQKSSGEIITA